VSNTLSYYDTELALKWRPLIFKKNLKFNLRAKNGKNEASSHSDEGLFKSLLLSLMRISTFLFQSFFYTFIFVVVQFNTL